MKTGGYPIMTDELGNMFKMETYLERINLDDEREEDIRNGNGFIIFQHQNIKKAIKEPNGIFSTRFGTTLDDVNPFIDKYKCSCGYTRHKINNGMICPICQTEVTFIDDNFNMFGWCVLNDDYHVIHPNLYKEIEVIIGSEKLMNIIKPIDNKNEDGFTIKTKPKSSKDKDKDEKDEPFKGKGLLWFRDHFEEVLFYYYNASSNKKSKKDTYEDILANKDKIFTHSIPVFTALLRPFKLDGGSFEYNDINGLYNIMVNIIRNINTDGLKLHKKSKSKLQLLFDLQGKLNRIYAEIEEILSGKKGILRQLFGGRCNFTSRDVIIPDDALRIDEVGLSYFALVGLLEQKIINILVKSHNLSYNDAHDIWFRAGSIKDDRVYNIIQSIIDSPKGVQILINRPPTIAYGSILQMRVSMILDNYTMSLPLQILETMAADFDGDALSVLLIINDTFYEEAHRVLNPKALYISRNNGMFNSTMNHSRDTIININTLLGLARPNYSQEQLEKIKRAKYL